MTLCHPERERGTWAGWVRASLAVACVFVALGALPAVADDGPLFQIYRDYVKAIDNSDLSAAKKFLSSGKLKHIEEMDAELEAKHPGYLAWVARQQAVQS